MDPQNKNVTPTLQMGGEFFPFKKRKKKGIGLPEEYITKQTITTKAQTTRHERELQPVRAPKKDQKKLKSDDRVSTTSKRQKNQFGGRPTLTQTQPQKPRLGLRNKHHQGGFGAKKGWVSIVVLHQIVGSSATPFF